MGNYVLVINVYNEEKQVKKIFNRIKKQTVLPDLFIWIDDGCTDSTIEEIQQHSEDFPVPLKILHSPPKLKPNYDTIGIAWNNVYQEIKKLDGYNYLMITDADSDFPETYAEDMIRYMDQHPEVGIVSGDIQGESRRIMPQNAGKVIRWPIVKNIDYFWDLVPDTFWNIKALSMGYRIVIRPEIKIIVPPSSGYSLRGRFRFGRIMYYVRSHPLLVIIRAIFFQIQEKSGTVFLKGYITEWLKGTWKCKIPLIRAFYSIRGTIMYLIMPEKLKFFLSKY